MSSTSDRRAAVPRGLVEAWRADEASPAELRRGYARFLRARPSPRRAPVVARYLVIGLILGAGLAQGATAVMRRFQPAGAQSMLAPQPPRAPERVGARRVAGSSAAAPSAVPAEPTPSATSVARPVAPSAVGAHGEPNAPNATAPTVQQQQWQRVAAAMRLRDFNTAEAALRELELNTHGSEREAVLLARAQLLASSGRTGEALTLARELEQRASSSVMRNKASELLTRLQENPRLDRSSASGAAIKQP